MKVKDTKFTFKRYEKKYLLTAAQYERIRARLDAYIEPDEFFAAGEIEPGQFIRPTVHKRQREAF